MYGGLFGDLPATKNDAKKGEDGDASADAFTTSTAIAPSTAGSEPPPAVRDSQVAKKPAAAPTMLPRFIPTQVKKPQRPQLLPRKRPLLSDSNLVVVRGAPATDIHLQGEDGTTVATDPGMATNASTTASSQTPDQDIDGMNQEAIVVERDAVAQVAVAAQDRHIYPSQEPEQLRLLHERAKEDPYDPLVPNDLLLYWERKALVVEREQLLLQREETIREHEQLRLQLEQERKQLEKQGDIGKVVEHRMQRSMGRGRGGVSNLPAWLVEKQRQQQQPQLEQERMQLEKQGYIDKVVEHRTQWSMGLGRGGVSNVPAWLVEKQRQQQQYPPPSSS